MEDEFGLSLAGLMFGALGWFTLRYVIFGFFTVNQNERVVKTSFGKAQRLHTTTLDNPMAEHLRPDERERYQYPQVRVIPPGGPVLQVAVGEGAQGEGRHRDGEPGLRPGDPEREPRWRDARGRHQGPAEHRPRRAAAVPRLGAATCTPTCSAVKNPLVHVLGYFISILRQRIASFEAPTPLPKALPPGDGEPPRRSR
jgi:hypothetical protein